jgi:KH domain-containing protein
MPSTPAPLQDMLDALYQAISGLSLRFDALDARIAALESKPPPPTAASKASTPARGPRAARSKSTKSKGPAATSAATQTPATTTIRTISTQVAQEKISVTLSIPDAQAGHVVGRAGTGLRQIHDLSHAKLSVSPTVVSGSRVVTIRGSSREVGDATAAIGKRLARRRLRTPRSTKKKTIPASTSPVVEKSTTTPSSSTTKPPMQAPPSRSANLPPPSLPSVELGSGSPSAVPTSSSSTVVDTSKYPRLAASMAGRRPKGQ